MTACDRMSQRNRGILAEIPGGPEDEFAAIGEGVDVSELALLMPVAMNWLLGFGIVCQ